MPLYLTLTMTKVKIKLLLYIFPNPHGCVLLILKFSKGYILLLSAALLLLNSNIILEISSLLHEVIINESFMALISSFEMA